IKIVISEISPPFLDLPTHLLPLPFHNIGIHLLCLLFINSVCSAEGRSPRGPCPHGTKNPAQVSAWDKKQDTCQTSDALPCHLSAVTLRSENTGTTTLFPRLLCPCACRDRAAVPTPE